MEFFKKILAIMLTCSVAITATSDVSAMKRKMSLSDSNNDECAKKKPRLNNQDTNKEVKLPVVKKLDGNKYRIGVRNFIEESGKIYFLSKKGERGLEAGDKYRDAVNAYKLGMVEQNPVQVQEKKDEADVLVDIVCSEKNAQQQIAPQNKAPFLVVADLVNKGSYVKYDIPMLYDQIQNAINNQKNSMEIGIQNGCQALVTGQHIQSKLARNVFFGSENSIFINIVYRHLLELVKKLSGNSQLSSQHLQNINASLVIPTATGPVVIVLSEEKEEDRDFEVDLDNVSYFTIIQDQNKNQEFLPKFPMIEMIENGAEDPQDQKVEDRVLELNELNEPKIEMVIEENAEVNQAVDQEEVNQEVDQVINRGEVDQVVNREEVNQEVDQAAEAFVRNNPNMTVGQLLYRFSDIACLGGVVGITFYQFANGEISFPTAFISTALVSKLFWKLHQVTEASSPITMVKNAWSSFFGQQAPQ